MQINTVSLWDHNTYQAVILPNIHIFFACFPYADCEISEAAQSSASSDKGNTRAFIFRFYLDNQILPWQYCYCNHMRFIYLHVCGLYRNRWCIRCTHQHWPPGNIYNKLNAFMLFDSFLAIQLKVYSLLIRFLILTSWWSVWWVFFVIVSSKFSKLF
jgi:hypothetical protein